MDNNKRYDFKDGAAGCLVGVVISAMVTIVFSLKEPAGHVLNP